MFQINHTSHSPARMPDAARMGNQGAAGVDKGAGADAGEDDDGGDGGESYADCRWIEVVMMMQGYIPRHIVCFTCMYNILTL